MDSKEEDADPNNKKKPEASTSTSNVGPGYVLGGSGSELRQRSVENNSAQTTASNNNLVAENNNPFSQFVNNQMNHQTSTSSSNPPPSSNINTGEQQQPQQQQTRLSSTPIPPSPPRRHVPVNNNNNNNIQVPPITEHLYQFQIRCILFLACAIFLGYMYLQIESNQSLLKYKLVPDSYGALRSSPKRHSSVKNPNNINSNNNNYKSKPTSHSSPEQVNEEEESESVSKISPEYRLQAEYLSKVLKSLGDMSMKFETNSNGSLSKSIQGIVEMKAEYEKAEDEESEGEEEDKNVPEYMKRLGTVIDDLKKAKVDSKTPGGKFKKFKPPTAKKMKQENPDGVLKKSEEDEKEWTEFVNDLVETAYKLSREGNDDDGGDGDERIQKNTRGKKYAVNDYNDGDEHKDSVKLNNGRKEGILDIDSDSDVLDLGLDDDSLFNEELDNLEEEEEEEEMYQQLKFHQKQQKNVESKTSSEAKQQKIKERLNFLEKLLEASNDELDKEELSIIPDDGDNSLKTQFEKNNFQKQKSSFTDKTNREHKTSKSKDSNHHNDDNNNKNNLFQDDNLYTLE